MHAVVLGILLVSAPPPFQVFSARQAADCARVRATLDERAPTPLKRKERDAWLATCVRLPDRVVACLGEAGETVESCRARARADCVVAIDAARTRGDVRLTEAQCAEMSAEAVACVADPSKEGGPDACDPHDACREAVSIIAEIASADPELSDKRRSEIIRAMTAPKSSIAEIEACTRVPAAVRLCVESAEAVAGLADCATVPKNWRPLGDGGEVEPFADAFAHACEARRANRDRLLKDVLEVPDEPGRCDAMALDWIVCEAKADTIGALAACEAERQSLCEKMTDRVNALLVTDPAVPERIREMDEQSRRAAVMAECLGATREQVDCLGSAATLSVASACYAETVCEQARGRLQTLVMDDQSLLLRDRSAIFRALRSSDFIARCSRAPASLRRCLLDATSWAAVRACTAVR